MGCCYSVLRTDLVGQQVARVASLRGCALRVRKAVLAFVEYCRGGAAAAWANAARVDEFEG
eukprot:109571-Alexandrium_andersonii.AAC.1